MGVEEGVLEKGNTAWIKGESISKKGECVCLGVMPAGEEA